MFSLIAHFSFSLLTFQDTVSRDILKQESFIFTEVSSKIVPGEGAMVSHGLVLSSHPYWILQHGVALCFSLVVCLVFFVCLFLKRQN